MLIFVPTLNLERIKISRQTDKLYKFLYVNFGFLI